MEESQPQIIEKSNSLAKSQPWIIEKSAKCGGVAAAGKGENGQK